MRIDEVDARLPGTDAGAILRQIVECGNQGIWVMDLDGCTVYANSKLADMLGYPVDEVRSLLLSDLLDEVGKVQAADFFRRQRQLDGTTETSESMLLRSDGAPVWTSISHSPWRSADGELLGLIAFVTDITDRRRVDEELRRRDEQFAEAQRVAHLGSWEWEVAADQIRWSDELYRIFGLTPNEFEATFQGYITMVHPDDRQIVIDEVTACLNGESRFELDHRVIRSDGGVVWVRSSGEALRDAEGHPLLMRGTALDITAFRATLDALQRTTSRYQLLQTMASAANAAESLEEVLEHAVREMCEQLRWPAVRAYLVSGDPPSLSSTACWRLDDPESRPAGGVPGSPGRGSACRPDSEAATRLAVQTYAAGEPRWQAEPGAMGSLEPFRGSSSTANFAFPVISDQKVVAVLEFVTDAQVRPVEAVELCEQVALQLARVAERERSNQELTAARDNAVEAARAKSAFLATMSHEIRTPMNGVVGLTDLLLSTSLDGRQRQYAEGVQSAGEALLAIINDILDFSKIEAGKLDLEIIDFEVPQIIEEVAGLVARQAHAKGVELLAHSRLNLPAVLRGDPARLRQVLLNLASNAIKFTNKGEVVLSARIESETEAAVRVRFEVTDTGMGISPENQQRLFQAFSQVDASTTRRFGGTGLGLAISKQLVEAMGGRLTVLSAPGKGSTFGFTLPLSRGDDSSIAPPSRRHLLDGTRVLVVDDNATNRLILHDQLTTWNVQPQLAESGAQALVLLHSAARRNEPIDLALLDLNMPGMDGLELARRINHDPALRGIRLIALTSADAEPADLQAGGVSASLTKPVRSSQLYDCLVRTLQPASTAPQRAQLVPAAPDQGSRGRLLVVEDNGTNQLVARGLLTRLGYRVDIAANGREALQALDRTDYVAVLMDCRMPEMDGYTATGEIRRHEGDGQHLPVIAMTAGALEGDEERCLAAGMDDYIAKPIRIGDLQTILDRWVSQQS